MKALVLPPTLNLFTAIELDFQTHTGMVYQLKASPDMINWTNFDSQIQGTGTNWSKTYSTRGPEKTFFRLELIP